MNGQDGKQSRTHLTAADRKIICEFAQKHPSYSHAQITEAANKQLGKQLAKSTVTKTLQNSEKWLTTTEQDGGRKRQRTAKFGDLEAALLLFCRQLQAQNGNWSDSLLQSEATRLAASMGLTEFSAFDGWLDGFKKRHHIKATASIDLARADVPRIIAYGECDVRDLENGPVDTDGAQPRVSYAAAKASLKTLTAYISEQPGLPPEAQIMMQRLTSMIVAHRVSFLLGSRTEADL